MSIIRAPFAYLLRFLTQILDSYGLALIVFALVVCLIRLPFDIRGKRSTMKTTLLQPKLKALQEKYASNQQKLQQEMQKLYQEEDVRPMSGCVWQLIPLVIILALYGIVRQPLTNLMGLTAEEIELLGSTITGMGYVLDESSAYYQVELASYIHEHFDVLRAVVPDIYDLRMDFLGLNLGAIPRWNFFMQDSWNGQDVGLFCLPLISVALSYISQRVMTITGYQQVTEQQGSMRMMMMLMPLMSLWIGFIFPAAMSIYWISNSLFNTIFNVFVNRYFKTIYEQMKAEMEEKDRLRELELEAKRKETERLRALNATRENKATSKKKKQMAEREKARQRQAALRKAEVEADGEHNPSRVGHRKYARGRAYDPDRFGVQIESFGENEIPELEPDMVEEGPEEETLAIEAYDGDTAETGDLPDGDYDSELEYDEPEDEEEPEDGEEEEN